MKPLTSVLLMEEGERDWKIVERLFTTLVWSCHAISLHIHILLARIAYCSAGFWGWSVSFLYQVRLPD